MKAIPLAWFTALSIAGVAHAQPAESVAWRCGADGRSYSEQPCASGRQVATNDARSANQLAQAKDVVAREKALARQLIAERHERERDAAQRGSGLIAIKPVAPAPQPRKEAGKKPPKKHRLEAAGTSASVAHGSRQKRG